MKPISKTPDLELAFDVGHSSIGMGRFADIVARVLREPKPRVSIFLAAASSPFAVMIVWPASVAITGGQRRYARSTRQRIEQMEKLQAHLKADSRAQLKAKTPASWRSCRCRGFWQREFSPAMARR